MKVYVDRIVRDEGSVVLFAGDNDYGEMITFACDHRPAQDLATRILEGDEVVECEVEDWQITGVERSE